jgi:trehalose synthase-fused probable maltokinase
MNDSRDRRPEFRAAAAAVEGVRAEELLRFLTAQRWFAAKGAMPTDVRLSSVVPLPWGGGAFALARVVIVVDDREQTYQLPLALREQPPARLSERAIVGGRGTNGGATLFDAPEDADFRRGLAAAFATGAAAAAPDGRRWVAAPSSVATLDLSPDVETRVGSAEQSNTAIIVGNRAIIKLLRRLEPGIHPEVEVGAFLTERAYFTHTPALLATSYFEDDGVRTLAGTMSEFLAGSQDAWSYALARGRAYFAAPPGREAANDFVADAKELGRVTRELHDALSSDDDDPDFVPQLVTDEHLERWATRAEQSISAATTLLERAIVSSALTRQRVAEGQILVQRRDRYLAFVNEIADELGDDLGMLIRTHGDYHLGQVLESADRGFMVIDFEGEPTRSLAERRERTSPLRDVAGMLRSFAYAAATLASSTEKTHDLGTREVRSARWERDVRAAFLDGYLGEGPPEGEIHEILPEERGNTLRLIALFETEKVFYELAYELNHRPDWAAIPMRGISKLLA